MAATVERLNARQLQYRLQQVQAVLKKEKSTAAAYIYLTPAGVWIKVKPMGTYYEVTYHNECPCALS